MDARGITAEELSDGTHRSTMEELVDWTLWADKVPRLDIETHQVAPSIAAVLALSAAPSSTCCGK